MSVHILKLPFVHYPNQQAVKKSDHYSLSLENDDSRIPGELIVLTLRSPMGAY